MNYSTDGHGAVKVLFAFDDAYAAAVGAAGESMWAEPVEADEGGGTYRLGNHPAYAAEVGFEDVVTAALNADGVLQVTEVTERSPRTSWLVECEHGPDHHDATVEDLRDGLGAEVESMHSGVFVCSALPDQAEVVGEYLQRLSDAGAVEYAEVSSPGLPTGPQEGYAPLRTEPSVPPHTTSYWAPDDPFWADNDMDDPEFLSFVQSLVSDDRRVARALENGRHDQVLAFVERTERLRRGEELPPLDGPVFG